MSDYFGALLRLSGMPVGDGALSAAAPLASAAQPATSTADQVPAAAQPHLASPTAESLRGRESPRDRDAAPALPSPPHAAWPEAIRRAQTDDVTGSVRAPAAVESSAAPAPTTTPAASRAVGASDSPAADALVRPAMRWVAADPGAAHLAIRPDEPETTILDRAAPDADFALPRPAPLPVRMPEVEPDLPPRRAAIAATQATARRRPEPRDELVEISIGAIHVRVDAPPPQTVASAPLPTPPRAPSTTAGQPSARSGLARRALRRI